jgi:cytochrome bd-type quinol oxidase subunit 1
VKNFYIKTMTLIAFSVVYGVAFTFGQWYASELIKEHKKREQIEENKNRMLDEIRLRREEMGISSN